MSATVEEIVAGLRAPVDLDTLVSSTLPAAGLYAWWRIDGALYAVPAVPHLTVPGLALIYVGIGPATVTSNETLYSRLVGKHVEGNTGSSTLRLTLAAHLLDTLELKPRATTTKVVLSAADNLRLTDWMRAHLRVTWVAHSSPWDVEAEVIAEMRPPLNIDHNRSHPYCQTNRDLRDAFRRAARQ